MDQTKYIEETLERFDHSQAKTKYTPIPIDWDPTRATNEKQQIKFIRHYQAIVGCLIYISTSTRPDITYAVIELSRHNQNPQKYHLNVAKHTLKYLLCTKDYKLRYSADGESLIGYTDSDWARDKSDRKSISGNCFFLAGGAVTWASKKQSTVALSSVEAEYIAAGFAAQQAMWIHHLFHELSINTKGKIKIHIHIQDLDEFKKQFPINLLSDSTGAIAHASNPVQHSRAKHIDIKYHFVRQCVEENYITFKYKQTNDMTADIFTKPLPWTKHDQHTKALGLN